VELPKYQLGMEAAELLLERIGGSTAPSVLRKLLPELRVRESCGFKLAGARNNEPKGK
jgi:DNA-binding LacI/PurR family transcriptional regulator